MTTDFRALCVELVRITDAFNSGTPLLSNQGQALDGYSALAAFCNVAIRARAALSDLEPPSLKEQALQAARIELVEGGKNAALILRALEALPDAD